MSDNTYIDWYMEKRKLQQEIEKQRKEICDKTDEIQKLQSEITDMCHDVFELQAGVKELKNENNQLRARVMELEASNAELLDALDEAQQFILNGIQYGYINMPDKDCGDSAFETPAKIEAAIQKARGQG